ncbi:hypothetical protein B0H13DRAFT_2280538 [Mycena leptocephala]|nr:hypothetical protein B0H13DRAFT_2280538 [Mycena leptocephala]
MVHINSDTGAELPPSVLTHIAKFTETLHKIHTFVEAQQKGSTLKNSSVKDLRFSGPMVNHMKDITQMQEDAEKRNTEVLAMIEAVSDTTISGFIQALITATQVELAALIGAHVGLKPGKDLTHPVIQYFSSSSNSLLILIILRHCGSQLSPEENRGISVTPHRLQCEEQKDLLKWHGLIHFCRSEALGTRCSTTNIYDIADNNMIQKRLTRNYLNSTWNTEEINQVLAQLLEYYQTTQTYKIQRIGQGYTSLIQQIHHVLPYPRDYHLEAYFITEWLNSWELHSISNLDSLVSDALEHFKKFDDPDLKCRFYNTLVTYYQMKGDLSSAKKSCETAISLALSTGNTKWHSQGLRSLAWVQWSLGDYSAGQVHANEAQQLALISADLYKEAQALNIEAICCLTLGNYTKAMSLCIRARDLLGLCGMSHGTLDYSIMTTQAEIHRFKSEYVEAHSIHTRILEGTTIHDPYNHGIALLNVAEIDVMVGAPKDDVQRNCETATKMYNILDYAEAVSTYGKEIHWQPGLFLKDVSNRALVLVKSQVIVWND